MSYTSGESGLCLTIAWSCAGHKRRPLGSLMNFGRRAVFVIFVRRGIIARVVWSLSEDQGTQASSSGNGGGLSEEFDESRLHALQLRDRFLA
jgi:hypothetical protein